jgi:D-3-phosphoglycerate dehydrogenase
VNPFDRAAFARMRPEAFFINASRGELVDDSALLDALDARLIAGAAVDVERAADQMPSPEVAAHPKVIASPHIGGRPPANIRQWTQCVRCKRC